MGGCISGYDCYPSNDCYFHSPLSSLHDNTIFGLPVVVVAVVAAVVVVVAVVCLVLARTDLFSQPSSVPSNWLNEPSHH